MARDPNKQDERGEQTGTEAGRKTPEAGSRATMEELEPGRKDTQVPAEEGRNRGRE